MRSLISVFKAQDLVLKGIATGVRVKLEPDVKIDIHNPAAGSMRAIAQIRIYQPDPGKKQEESGRICDQLRKKTTGVASIYPFKAVKDTPDVFVYEAIVDLSQSPTYHETVVFGDAGEEQAPEEAAAGEAASEVPEEFQSPAATAVELLETVDARTFRQALDALDLPRTSNLRLALSRLQRSAIDAEELNDTAKTEAARLTAQADIETLGRIQSLNSPDFLDCLITLLSKNLNQQLMAP